jgi:uncharacterized protein YukE
MRICNLSDGLGQLGRAAADLNQHWADTQMHWTDESSREFQAAYLQPIPSQMQLLIAAVQALASTVEKAARELDVCSETT